MKQIYLYYICVRLEEDIYLPGLLTDSVENGVTIFQFSMDSDVIAVFKDPSSSADDKTRVRFVNIE